uniref:Uncharacterized protein n=1 Tax=Arundo donax TaxID=35708 RepID=A0A0A8Z125_ARUDO
MSKMLKIHFPKVNTYFPLKS